MTAVFVAVPSVEWRWTQAAVAQQHLTLPPGSRFFHPRGRSSIAKKRNALAEAFLRQGEFTHLLFLDSDMTPPPQLTLDTYSHVVPGMQERASERLDALLRHRRQRSKGIILPKTKAGSLGPASAISLLFR